MRLMVCCFSTTNAGQSWTVNDPGFSDSEKMAMTMVTFGGLLSMNPSILGSLDEAMQKCASLN